LLSKEQRKMLLEHNWSYFMKEDTNPSQSRRRVIEKASTSLRDLTIIANRLPKEELDKIFNEKILQKLLFNILYSKDREEYVNFNAELASFLVSFAIPFCLSKYKSLNQETPQTAQPVIDYINRAKDICKEIGYKTKIERIEKESKQKNQQYICRIDEIGKKDEHRFFNFVTNELNLYEYIDITKIQTKGHNIFHKEIIIDLTEWGTEKFIGDIRLDIHFDSDLDGGICKLVYTPDDASPDDGFKHKELVVKKSGNDYILLKKEPNKIHH
jgi:hypothetical protein